MRRIFIYLMLLMGAVLPSAAKNRAQQVIAHRDIGRRKAQRRTLSLPCKIPTTLECTVRSLTFT